MPSNASSVRRLPAILAFILGILFVVVACGILASHARLFSVKRDTAVMIGTQLPELKSSVALLQASVEAEGLFAERALAAREEQASAYVFPKDSPVARTVSLLQETVLGLKGSGSLALVKISFGRKAEDHGSVKTTQGIAVFRGSFQDIANVLTVLGYSGDMMVRDVLPVQDQQAFLREAERSAPLSLKTCEDFLYLDLVEYASAPDKAEGRLVADAPNDAMLQIRSALLQAGLASVRSALGPVASRLKTRELWPMPLLRVDSVARDADTWTVTLTAFSR